MARRNVVENIVFVMFLAGAFPILVGKILIAQFSLKYIDIPLHAGIEVAGGVMAIAISILFFVKYLSSKILARFTYTLVALLVMGIIDIFHGVTMPGELFVWLHSTAVFFGGILFVSVWIDERSVSLSTYKTLPFLAIVFAIIFCMISINYPEIIPNMFNEDKTFSNMANWLNIVGGICFFVASLKFIKEYSISNETEDLLFAGITILFGIAGVLFVSSVLWDAQWWLWHMLRLLAYCIAFYFLYAAYEKGVKYIEQTNKKINKYVNIVDENVITSRTNIDGTITQVSDAFCKISEYDRDELIGKSHNIIRHPDVPKEVYNNLWETLAKNKPWYGELKNSTKNGGYYWVDASISPVFDDEENKVGYTSIRQDITAKKKLEEISITDGLTNIYNRRYFDEIFPKVLNSAKRKNELISFLIMDIDYFKRYNDTYGHQMGDAVLVAIGKLLKETLHRADDYCFRLGGEEFGIIFKSDTKEKAIVFANTIRANIENLSIEHKHNSASRFVSASIGLTCKSAQHIQSVGAIYKESDELLYKAKNSGKNRVATNE